MSDSNCGQVLISEVAGIELRKVEAHVGHSQGLDPFDVYRALIHFGVAVGSPMTYNGLDYDDAILLVKTPGGTYHWLRGSTRDFKRSDIHTIMVLEITDPRSYFEEWDKRHGIVHEKR